KPNTFSANFFDSAIFISTLHCIETAKEREKALSELFRVMKKNGEAMITVWKKEEMIKAWNNQKVIDLDFNVLTTKETFVNWKKGGVNYQRYYYFYDEKELENLLRKVGFKILKSIKQDSAHSNKNIVVYVQKK
ncbi:MAG: methyltransferase domain-containing protein, partial [Nanoarchaeota archaeon]